MATEDSKQIQETKNESETTQGILTDSGENDYAFDGYKIILNKKIALVPKAKSKK